MSRALPTRSIWGSRRIRQSISCSTTTTTIATSSTSKNHHHQRRRASVNTTYDHTKQQQQLESQQQQQQKQQHLREKYNQRSQILDMEDKNNNTFNANGEIQQKNNNDHKLPLPEENLEYKDQNEHHCQQ